MRVGALAGLGWFAFLIAACDGPPEHHGPPWEGYEAVAPAGGGPPVTVTHEPATRPGPGGRAFGVQLRSSELEHYPCATCHEDASGRAVRLPRSADRAAHANINPVHPSTTEAGCFSCHASSDYEALALENGSTVALDHAYGLCAQCHFQQAEDWAGGAHGKRSTAWLSERVVYSCTACHNPHDPAFETRVPMRGPSIPRTGGTQ